MALRLVDIYRPDDGSALTLPDDSYDLLGHWTYTLDDNQRVDRVLVNVDETEALVDWVDRAVTTEYRVTLQSVEATLPRPEADDDEEAERKDADDNNSSSGRVSREELYEYARTATDVDATYYALVLLSTVVAAGGMLRDQVAVVIGAMMIAPLIGPNLALALGTTLGDTTLLRRSVRATVTGVGVAFGTSLIMGMVLPVSPDTGEVAARTVIGLADVVLATAAGAAGALSVTRDGDTALVGVMVAVALLPPIVAVGLLLGAGHLAGAGAAGILTATNVAAVNLAAVCTFLAQGILPRDWHEVEQARTSTRIALALWVALVAILSALLWWVA
ncbi:MAG: TIGR00341 family protein [Salinivenus sp.]